MHPLLALSTSESTFGFPEALRIVLVALAALNIGTLAGRLRSYWKTSRLIRSATSGSAADLPTVRAVGVFYCGCTIIFASVAWRIVQLYHSPASAPLVALAVGMTLSLVGLRRMTKHVTPRILSEDSVATMVEIRERRRKPNRR